MGTITIIRGERKALLVYNNEDVNTPTDSLKSMLSRGITSWNENIKLITELDKLQLPDTLHKRDEIILDYCMLRLKSYELMNKSVEENSKDYDAEINTYNDSIRIDLERLK